MNCMWLKLVRESAYKTPVTPTTINEDYLVIELLDDDPASIELEPNTEQLYSWLACGDPDRGIGETYQITGTIRTLLYPDQAPILLGWAMREVADQAVTGEEIPWVTSEPAGQLASMSADFAYRDNNGNERKDRFLGGKVTGFTLGAVRGTRDGAFVLELQVAFSERTTTTATAPAASDYPAAATSPYFLSAATGNLTIDGTAIDEFRAVTVAGAYTAPITFNEQPTITRIRHYRKEFTLEVNGDLLFAPDWRALRDDRSVFDAELILTYPGGTGAQEITLDFGDNCRVNGADGWSKQLPINADRLQTLSVISQFSRTLERTLALTIGVQA
jgi:hypothetical protein